MRHKQCWPQSIFGDTIHLCYCRLRLVTRKSPLMVGAEGRKIFDFDNLDHWKRHFQEKNYIENYFYLVKSTKSTKITSQKFWRNIFGQIFWGAHTTQTVSKHIWVRRWQVLPTLVELESQNNCLSICPFLRPSICSTVYDFIASIVVTHH